MNNNDNNTTGETGYGVTNKTIDVVNATTDNAGGGSSHNNMPP